MNDDAAVLAIVCYGEGEEDAAVALGKLVFVGMIHNKDKDTGESSPVHACEFCSKGRWKEWTVHFKNVDKRKFGDTSSSQFNSVSIRSVVEFRVLIVGPLMFCSLNLISSWDASRLF